MAGTFKGIGSTYYGRWRVESEDQEYAIRTEWFVVFWVPILPIGSLVVFAETGERYTGFFPFFWGSSRKILAREVPLFWPQIFRTWSVMVLGVVAIVLFGIVGSAAAGWAADALLNNIPAQRELPAPVIEYVDESDDTRSMGFKVGLSAAWFLLLAVPALGSMRSAARFLKLTRSSDSPYESGEPRHWSITWVLLANPILGRLFPEQLREAAANHIVSRWSESTLDEYAYQMTAPLWAFIVSFVGPPAFFSIW